MQGGETEQWGDKWEERFKEGKGTKKVRICQDGQSALPIKSIADDQQSVVSQSHVTVLKLMWLIVLEQGNLQLTALGLGKFAWGFGSAMNTQLSLSVFGRAVQVCRTSLR